MTNRDVLASIEAEYRRYKALGEAAILQLSSEEPATSSIGSNSVATLVWHISGNLESRFTDFLVSDGEKPWRDRESEFETRAGDPAELLAKWEVGWGALLSTLESMNDETLIETVVIRNIPLTVHEALHRSLAHTSYHVGQIVLISRGLKGEEWQFLSIPPGGSDAYNRNPSLEKASDYVASAKTHTD